MTVLDHTYEYVDYLSLHSYYGNKNNNTQDFLACSLDMDAFIRSVVSICDSVKAIKRSKKTMMLSFDEWNVMFHSDEDDKKLAPWQVAPHQLEDVYTLEDALVVGCLLITLLKHADRVKMACLAQLVNVIAPIMTENGGGAWAQPTYYPFRDTSTLGHGIVLTPVLDCPTYESSYGKAAYAETVAVYNEEANALTVFAVNRHLDESLFLDMDLSDFEGYEPVEHRILTGDNLKAVNTAKNPCAVAPSTKALPEINGKKVTVELPARSWNVVQFKKKV